MIKFTKQPVRFPTLRTHGLASSKGAMFGMTRNGGKRAHQGIDLAIDKGYRCYSVEDGNVVSTSLGANGYGYTVTVKLECENKDLNGKFAFYAHLSRIDVKVGEKIKAGTVIGLSGDTGNAKGMDEVSEGAHLHFEIRTKQICGLGLTNRIDPLPFVELIS